MRSFQQVVALLFVLVAFAFANEAAYDATVYVTSTVYRVNTVSLSSSPSGSVVNQTSTIPAVAMSVGTVIPAYPSSNGTSNSASPAPYPTATGSSLTPSGTGVPPKVSSSPFPGAASSLNVNAFVAALAAGVAYLAL